MKKITIALVIATMVTLSAEASLKRSLKNSLRVTLTPEMISMVEQNGLIDIKFEIDMPEKFMNEGAVYMITPFLTNGENLEKMSSMVVEGKRAMKRMERKGMKNPENLIDAMYIPWEKKGQSMIYHTKVVYEPWMKNAKLMIDERFITNHKNIEIAQTLFGEGVVLTTKPIVIEAPKAQIVKHHTQVEHGTVRLNFNINSSNIDLNLADNRFELAMLAQIIDNIDSNSSNTIDSVVLVASSSPDGILEENRELTIARAHAVKDFLMTSKMDVPMDNIKIHCIDENWAMLKTLMMMAPQTNKQEVLSIFDIANLDERSKALYSLKEFGFIKEHILPQLRYVQYKIYYHAKNTTHK